MPRRLSKQKNRRAQKAVCEISEVIKNDYSSVDDGIAIDVKEAASKEKAANADSTEKAVVMLSALPCGLISMSRDIEGLPETSLNLGILKTEESEISAEFLYKKQRTAEERGTQESPRSDYESHRRQGNFLRRLPRMGI